MISELKRDARKRLKKLYVLSVMICLMAGAFGVDYGASIGYLKDFMTDGKIIVPNNEQHISVIMEDLAEGHVKEAQKDAAQFFKDDSHIKTVHLGVISVGHRRGVLARVINNIDSGEYLITLYEGIYSITETRELTLGILIVLGMAVLIFFRVFFNAIVRITYTRIFLEGRIYDKISSSKIMYLVRVKKWVKVSLAMFLMNIYTALWSLTIVGAFIKPFSYLMVPYILAENPDISGKDAITLSRRMMDGHKFEAFLLLLSFIGWQILDVVSFGLVGILYANPYKEATFAQYYARIRAIAKENNIEGAELLNDKYLFEYASDESLNEAYSDGAGLIKYAKKELPKNTGFRGFIEEHLGLTLLYDEKEKAYEKAKINQTLGKAYMAIIGRQMYPTRLFTLEGMIDIKEPGKHHYNRHYSIISIIMIFFIICIIGWTHEVLLHLVRDGVLVNRGVMHGPWLPIYGSGGVLILICLNKFRRNPVVQFVLAVILCGIVEYSSAVFLEVTHGGMKWWNYTDCFININGRVCAEGLLLFGLGGIAIVYVLAPALDNLFRRINLKILAPVAVLLVLVFAGDAIYSIGHPNKGDGITSQNTNQITNIIATEVHPEG